MDDNKTIATFRTNAEARGPRWGITSMWPLAAVQLLYYIEYANANSQTQIGRGIVDDPGAGQVTGLNSADTNIAVNGTGTGTGTDGLTPAVYRGIENLWGNTGQFIDGWNALNTEYRIIRRDGTGVLQDALAYGGYEVSIAAPIVADGYVRNIEYEDLLKYLFIPSTLNGSSTTYLCDYFYAHNPEEVNILIFGGSWDDGSRAGVVYFSTDQMKNTFDSYFSARLEFV